MKMKDAVREAVATGDTKQIATLCMQLWRSGLNYEGVVEFFEAHGAQPGTGSVRAMIDEAIREHVEPNRR